MVLRAKFAGLDSDAGSGTGPELVRVRLRDIGVGHSAHVSLHGYIPATPYRSPGATLDTVACWLTDHELTALDATEPNYHRMTFTNTYLDDATAIAAQSFSIYVSAHGVLADPSSELPVPLGPQDRIITWLRGHLADEIPDGEAESVCARLSEPATAARITNAMARSGLVVDGGVSILEQPAGVPR